jgi:hypothetical protein
VTGTIFFTVKKRVANSIPVVSIFGKEIANVIPTVKQDGFAYITKANRVVYAEHLALPSPSSSPTVDPGSYQLRFETKVPITAPPTIKFMPTVTPDANFRLRHVVRVTLENQHVLAEIPLVVAPTPQPPQATPGKIIRPYKAGKGNISVVFVVEDTNLKPGGTLSLRAVCRNRSNLPIKQVKIKFIEKRNVEDRDAGRSKISWWEAVCLPE